MLGRLVVIAGPDTGTEFPVSENGGSVGRSSQARFRLSDPTVSRMHAGVIVEGRKVVIEALSDARTLLNGRPIDGRCDVVEGDEMVLGQSRLVFLGPVSVRTGPPEETTVITARLSGDQVLSQSLADDPATSRLRRHLICIVECAAAARQAGDPDGAAAVCTARLAKATIADRSSCFVPDAVGRQRALAVTAEDPKRRSTTLALPEEVRRSVDADIGLITRDSGGDVCQSIVAPIPLADGRRGVLLLERFAGSDAKPDWDDDELRFAICAGIALGAALDWQRERSRLLFDRRVLGERAESIREFVGTSPAAVDVKKFIAKVAPTDATVLLVGESGSGKEVVARSVHESSRRSDGPFVAVNCAALRENLIESELFGHERGAFTGATGRKLGRFERADGGTLFLDEVGELDERCQTKLLPVLEERTFERVGGSDNVAVDVRVVAATNRKLEEHVRDGRFRSDLYFRLCVVRLDIPPLRVRSEDLADLADHLLGRLRPHFGRRVDGFADDALAAIRAYKWPGNVRELRNAIERAGVLGEERLIRAKDLPMAVRAAIGDAATALSGNASLSLREAERAAIARALEASSGNKREAAKLLGIDRSSLYKKLARLRIEES